MKLQKLLFIDRNLLEKFGYCIEWLDYQILDEDYFFSQVTEQEYSGDENFEHFRYGAFLHWIENRNVASDQEIFNFIEIALKDPDITMAGGAVIRLLEPEWITDCQFEKISFEIRKFGEWTAP